MCLIVKEVAVKKTPLIVQCSKELVSIGLFYETPYRITRVPFNGLLIAKGKRPKQLFFRQKIYGGYIHSYMTKRRGTFNCSFTAYAIKPIAFGIKDMISLAVYIPALDRNRERAKKFLNSRVTKKMLLEMFPSLRRIEHLL